MRSVHEKMRKLGHVRKLWEGILETTTIIDVFKDEPIRQNAYNVDHFIPWSFVMNDELWNLMPMDSSLNSSKSNRLPQWDKFFVKFANNQYVMYEQVHEKRGFANCTRRVIEISFISEDKLEIYKSEKESLQSKLQQSESERFSLISTIKKGEVEKEEIRNQAELKQVELQKKNDELNERRKKDIESQISDIEHRKEKADAKIFKSLKIRKYFVIGTVILYYAGFCLSF